MARLIAVISEPTQVGFLLDDLKKAGFDRKDIIVSDGVNGKDLTPDEIPYTQSETDELWQTDRRISSLMQQIHEQLPFEAEMGIVVAVEASKHQLPRAQQLMEQNGASYIFCD